MRFVALSAADTIVLVVSIAASYLLALPLGWERKARSSAYVGLRVFPLVSVSSCVYVFLGQHLFTGSHSGEKTVSGVTTAASVWTTGAIGASVAYGYYTVAVVLTLANLFVVDITRRLARHTGVLHDDAGSP